jgi:transcriptional regulator with XRE-family HTH domain
VHPTSVSTEHHAMSDGMAMALARAIRAERARSGYSQLQLADRLGWSRQVVSAVETGVRRVYADELPELCEALSVPLHVLLSRIPDEDWQRLGL